MHCNAGVDRRGLLIAAGVDRVPSSARARIALSLFGPPIDFGPPIHFGSTRAHPKPKGRRVAARAAPRAPRFTARLRRLHRGPLHLAKERTDGLTRRPSPAGGVRESCN